MLPSSILLLSTYTAIWLTYLLLLLLFSRICVCVFRSFYSVKFYFVRQIFDYEYYFCRTMDGNWRRNFRSNNCITALAEKSKHTIWLKLCHNIQLELFAGWKTLCFDNFAIKIWIFSEFMYLILFLFIIWNAKLNILTQHLINDNLNLYFESFVKSLCITLLKWQLFCSE